MTDATDHFTRHWALALDNDEGFYDHRRALAQQVVASESDTPTVDLADALKDWSEELVYGEDYDSLPMLTRELLSGALGFVDWHELARRYLRPDELD